MTLRFAGSESWPSRKSGEERWKKESAWRLEDLAVVEEAPQARRRPRGISTASSSSPALAEVSMWLTGQMPQMRDVMPGISRKERPSQNFSKPRNSTTWKRASETSPWSSRMEGDLRVALDAGDGVDDDALAHGVVPLAVLERSWRSGVRPATSSVSTKWMRSAEGGQPGRKTSTGTTSCTGRTRSSSTGTMPGSAGRRGLTSAFSM